MERQIHPADADNIRRMLCLREEEAEVPEDVAAAYWKFRIPFSRIMGGAPVSPESLAFLLLPFMPADVPPPLDLSGLQEGDEINVRWRKKECAGKFIELTRRKTAKVLLEGEEEPREVPLDVVLGVLTRG